MGFPYRVSTLLYVFDPDDRVLLLERLREPNLGLWSPPGGKVDLEAGESPYACGCREAHEEMGIQIQPEDLHLTGVVSECGFLGEAHWLMFLFEVRPRFSAVPPAIAEGRFAFHARSVLDGLAVPRTDAAAIWPLFWRHRGGFFAAHCRCGPDGSEDVWTLEESRVPAHPSAGERRPAH